MRAGTERRMAGLPADRPSCIAYGGCFPCLRTDHRRVSESAEEIFLSYVLCKFIFCHRWQVHNLIAFHFPHRLRHSAPSLPALPIAAHLHRFIFHFLVAANFIPLVSIQNAAVPHRNGFFAALPNQAVFKPAFLFRGQWNAQPLELRVDLPDLFHVFSLIPLPWRFRCRSYQRRLHSVPSAAFRAVSRSPVPQSAALPCRYHPEAPCSGCRRNYPPSTGHAAHPLFPPLPPAPPAFCSAGG